MSARSIRDFDVNPEKILALIPEGVSLDVLRDRGVVPLSLGGGVYDGRGIGLRRDGPTHSCSPPRRARA